MTLLSKQLKQIIAKIEGLESRVNSIKVPANSDLNDYQTTGFFYSNSTADAKTMSNLPVATAFSLLVERNAGYTQIFTTYSITNPQMFVRNCYLGSWGDWKEINLT